MSKYLKTLAVVASLAAASAAHAVVAPSFTVYTDQASWEAAVAGLKIGLEDFSDSTVPDFTINSASATISGGVLNDFDYKWNTSSYAFAKDILAIGGNWNLSPQDPGSGLNLYVNGSLAGTIASSYNGGFFGFVSNTPFATLTIKMGSENTIGEHYTVDNIRFAAPVPEPETYAMLVAGLGLLGAVARRRKQHD